MKKILLKKNLTLPRKTLKPKLTAQKNDYHTQLNDYHIQLNAGIKRSEEQNKTPPVIGKWYKYKDRKPPNDFESYVVVKRGENSYDVLNSATMLQHYISELEIYGRMPVYTEWILLPK